jgi:hypothetical protein
MRSRYDMPTAITFLLAGLGLGTLIALLVAPREKNDPAFSDARRAERRRELRPVRAV